jgi:hypothetical protein
MQLVGCSFSVISYSLTSLFAKNTDTVFSTDSPTWDAEMMSFILPPVVLLAAASGVCMYVCHRRDKKMRHERRCQYNEVRKLYCDIKIICTFINY